MEFKKFSVGNYCYGVSDPIVDKEKLKEDGITNVNFSDPDLANHMKNHESENF